MKIKSKVVYISGKYHSKDGPNGVWENICTARRVAREYWLKGYPVLCPHTNSSFMDGIGTDDLFLEGDLELIKRCDIIVMLPEWKESVGATAEHKLAKRLGKEIVYL